MDARVVSGPAFEVVAELAAFASGPARPSLESGKPWIRRVRALAGRDLIKRVDRWGFSAYGELTSIVVDAGPPFDIDQLVARVRVLPADVLVRRLLGAESAESESYVADGTFDRAFAGQRAARSQLRRGLGMNAQARQAIVRILRTPPRTVQRDIAGVVEAWAERVHPAFAETSATLVARDVAAKEQLLRDKPVRDVLRASTNVDYDPSSWATEVVIVPTVALRPFIVPMDRGATAILLCSVADEAYDDDPAAPPRRLVKVAAALGDELRLRILHALGSEDMSATQLADHLGVDRTSLHHHLGILRSAGLVGATAEGPQSWRYALRAEGIADATDALGGYVGSRVAGRG